MRANRMSISRTHRTLHWTEEKASRCRLSMGTTVFLCAGMFTMYFLDAVLEGASEIYLLRSTTCTVIAQPEAPAVCAVTSTDGERRTVLPGVSEHKCGLVGGEHFQRSPVTPSIAPVRCIIPECLGMFNVHGCERDGYCLHLAVNVTTYGTFEKDRRGKWHPSADAEPHHVVSQCA